MTDQFVELSRVLRLLPPTSAARLAEAAEGGLQVECVMTRDASGPRNRLRCRVGG